MLSTCMKKAETPGACACACTAACVLSALLDTHREAPRAHACTSCRAQPILALTCPNPPGTDACALKMNENHAGLAA